jgi:hypothetical protein
MGREVPKCPSTSVKYFGVDGQYVLQSSDPRCLLPVNVLGTNIPVEPLLYRIRALASAKQVASKGEEVRGAAVRGVARHASSLRREV